MATVLIRASCAALLAMVQLAAWAGLGSLILSAALDDDDVLLGVCLLVGAALTSFVYAVTTRTVGVVPTLIAGVVLSGGGLLFGGRRVFADLRRLWCRARPTWKADRIVSAALIAGICLYVVHAASPPRSSDVLRYHLAHIRQIIADDAWVGLSDLHYALPFGWTLNFLPFEYIRLPETAHFLNLGIWLFSSLTMLAWLHERGVGSMAPLMVVLLALQPMTVEAVTTASADSYSMLVVTVIVILLVEAPLSPVHAAALGFAAWVGGQSRYQLLAVGVATSFVFIWHSRTTRDRRWIAAFIGGSLVAAVLAAPFYASNLKQFGNAVWPMMVDGTREVATYSDRIAAKYAAAQRGSYDPRAVAITTGWLLIKLISFPIPLLLIGLALSAPFGADPLRRRCAAFVASFMIVWVAVQPRLYERYAISLVPAVAIGVTLFFRPKVHDAIARLGRLIAMCGIVVFVGFGLIGQADFVQYAVTGDADAFNEITWYHNTFTWLNASLPLDARVVVIMGGAQTYPLQRWYRRADPDFSAEIDWTVVATARQLDSALAVQRIGWLVFDDRDWSGAPGGANMTRAVYEGIQSGRLQTITTIEESLSISRRRNRSTSTRILVLRKR